LRVKPELVDNVKNIKAIFTTSEQLLPQNRQLIEAAFNKPVFDMYGANDGGILTCECPMHSGYHINTLNCYVETFTNEFGMSELLLSNLNSFGFPLVRYRVGDLGEVETGNCECGLNWPRVTELKGRTRDVIKLKDGTSIHGSLFNKVFYRYEKIDGYKIVQNKDLTITLYIHLKNEEQFEFISSNLRHDFNEIIGSIELKVELMHEQNPTNQKFKLIESHAI
jgi:phenylacetate-CoA ligase